MMDFRLILDIEAEFGPLPQLAARFRSGGWAVGELVGLLQMIEGNADDDSPVDFIELGERLLAEGLPSARQLALQFFDRVLGAEFFQ